MSFEVSVFSTDDSSRVFRLLALLTQHNFIFSYFLQEKNATHLEYASDNESVMFGYVLVLKVLGNVKCLYTR